MILLSLRSTLFALLGVLCLVPLQKSSAATPAESTRSRTMTSLNNGWKFVLGDPAGAGAPSFDDHTWAAVGLPHSFSLPYFGSPQFYVGYGWYRKTLDLPASLKGKRLFLEFDGVFQVAEVFVNGTPVGRHEGGYTGFSFDITSAARSGANTIAVRVNNLWNARLAPRAGEHVFSGGIYRDVRLVATAPLHVAWYGTFITTPQVSAQSGTVKVQTEVVNDSAEAKSVTLQSTILDRTGQAVATVSSRQPVSAHQTVTFDQTSAPITSPQLWGPDHPDLYSVKTTVWDGQTVVDDFHSSFGFRSIKFTADQGFFLNGDHTYLHGANVHQDHAGWGDAVADRGFFRDVSLVKQAGFDFIRGSHYPKAPAFVEACDELGVMLWSENCFWGIGGFKADGYWNSSAYPPAPADQPAFEASVKQQLREMIRIHRNHPSIITWSMGNETFFTEKSALPKLRTFLSELVAYTHELDPTRPAAIGGVQRPLDANRIDTLGDLAGYNGDGATLSIFQKAGVPSLVGEYGSTTSRRPGKYEPGWGDLGKQMEGGQPKEFPWRSGQAIWCMFDHGSIAGKNLGTMGIVDYFRIPKRAWYWYRNNYLHIPPPEWPASGTPTALKLSADRTTLQHADGTDDAQILVTVVDQAGKAISNCPPVKLAVESGPGEFPTGPEINFDPKSDIAILDGQAAIEFRSYYAGKTVLRATSPGLQEATLEITTLDGSPYLAGTTPAVAPRPYVRFTTAVSANAATRFGTNNPTQASSEASGHNSGLGNDDDAHSAWQAALSDAHAWWAVDLEKLVAVKSVTLTFPSPGEWRYRIEASNDGRSGWKLVSDQTRSTDKTATQTVSSSGEVAGRFLRVVFTGEPPSQPAGLAEIEVTGSQPAQ
ncbi:MAG: glycoside hydrolase family 2 TIM barrel-domain containing protein [Chthoniobacteraceae bacterium]